MTVSQLPADATAAPSPARDAAWACSSQDQIVDWFCSTYAIADKRRVRAPLHRALLALQQAHPDRTQLQLEHDILPKLQVLEELSPGLGWRVFARYPEELIHPDAVDYWGILAACLFTTGFTPAKISQLFRRHPSLFAWVVRDPANLRAIFDWFRDLGLGQDAVLSMLSKMPLLLQMDVESVLKPRLQYMLDLPLPLPRAVAALRRQPTLWGVDSGVLQRRVDHLEGLGLTRPQVAALMASDPSIFVTGIDSKIQPMLRYLESDLGCDPCLVQKLVSRGGVLTRSLDTLQGRVRFWREAGFSDGALLRMLRRFPRLLLFPMDSPHNQAKLEFLRGQLQLPLSALESFPQYVSYSLDKRIAPRAAAAAELAGRKLTLTQLATSDAAFCRHYGIDRGLYAAFLAAWGSGSRQESDCFPLQQGSESCRHSDFSAQRHYTVS